MPEDIAREAAEIIVSISLMLMGIPLESKLKPPPVTPPEIKSTDTVLNEEYEIEPIPLDREISPDEDEELLAWLLLAVMKDKKPQAQAEELKPTAI